MLDRILPQLPSQENPNLIVGPGTFDDAGVYRVRDDLALVQTVDFFTPIVDDGYDFGRIAAANSLSDIYAMGATPVTALNILAVPENELPDDVLAAILSGSAAICAGAGVAVAGGHSVSDPEIKFGLAVTGLLDPRQPMLTNSGARPGDRLVLTKALGTGLISNAMMNDAAPEGAVEAMTASMVRLNRLAAELARKHGARAATDITGFGLLGHARELARASGVMLELSAGALPALPGAMIVADSGSYFSGGERRNRAFVEQDCLLDAGVPEALARLASDPQTSGGLLVALPEGTADAYLADLAAGGEEGWTVGEVKEPGKVALRLLP